MQAAPSDLSSVADLPNLTKELLRRGYSEQDVDKILGGNMLRVMEKIDSLSH
jgi:membrane dipeptidase